MTQSLRGDANVGHLSEDRYCLRSSRGITDTHDPLEGSSKTDGRENYLIRIQDRVAEWSSVCGCSRYIGSERSRACMCALSLAGFVVALPEFR